LPVDILGGYLDITCLAVDATTESVRNAEKDILIPTYIEKGKHI
jgi:hypothetical protein